MQLITHLPNSRWVFWWWNFRGRVLWNRNIEVSLNPRSHSYLPGPCAPPGVIRPRRNMTALSYSATTCKGVKFKVSGWGSQSDHYLSRLRSWSGHVRRQRGNNDQNKLFQRNHIIRKTCRVLFVVWIQFSFRRLRQRFIVGKAST
jgi:hypothetical protein